ncbi:glycosyltransferase [Leifsonia flava]|uniref:Glycosyltransferase n=1 Tax=Orlajensenia leifsoniae TaxID=2561933 RepID=A0A4Y9QXU9_9MICO|nr:glycosyltransferase [Leifsonia flava]TFV96492.1 glycosyltransferase [Leifsonia flava]
MGEKSRDEIPVDRMKGASDIDDKNVSGVVTRVRSLVKVPEKLKPAVRESFERFASSLDRWPTIAETVRGRQFIHALLSSRIIDRTYYEAQAGRQFVSDADVAQHFVSVGAEAGLSVNPLIEDEWFRRAANRGVASANTLLFDGTIGLAELGPLFDAKRYAGETGSGIRSSLGALQHFLAATTESTMAPTSERIAEVETSESYNEKRELLIEEARRYARLKAFGGPRLRPAAASDLQQSSEFLRAHVGALSGAVERPMVSIVMPARDRAHRLDESVRSVLAQTYENWELIIVDDGSVDSTPDVLREWSAIEPRIRVLTQEPSGVSAARNRAISAAEGVYIAFLDSDNAWAPEFLALTMAWMTSHNDRVVHTAILRHVGSSRILYQGSQVLGHEQLLQAGNSVDLNALVASAELVRAVGGFDDRLRRWVDYDLVLKLSLHEVPTFLPYIGVHYDDAVGNEGRISTTEAGTWEKAVLEKYLCDWPRVEGASRVDGRISVVIRSNADTWRTIEAVSDVFATNPDKDIEVVVVVSGASRGVSASIVAALGANPRVTIVPLLRRHSFGLEANVAFGNTTGEFVCFVDLGVAGSSNWLEPLVSHLDGDHTLGAVQPLIIGADETVASAGLAFGGSHILPWDNLDGHPVEDAEAAALPRRVAAVSWRAMLVRASTFIAARGFDVLYGDGYGDSKFCLRLRQMGFGSGLVSESRLRIRPGYKWERSIDQVGAARLLNEFGPTLPEPDQEMYRSIGAEIRGYQASSVLSSALARIGQPIIVRDPSDTCLRWAIKTAAPAGPRGDRWGDTLFAEDLAAALRSHSQRAFVDRREGVGRRSAHLDDVVIVLRGLDRVAPQPGATNILWLISHPELVTAEEIAAFDLVFAASAPWAELATRKYGREVLPLLQATNVRRFDPELRTDEAASDVLFVGSTRKTYRPIVRWANDVDADLSIFGPGWDGLVAPERIKGLSLGPDEVGTHYASARVVLNDHWADMAAEGFISNRLFDAVASGAWVVSDAVEGMGELFGDAVRIVGSREELRTALDDPSARPPRDELLRQAGRVRSEHSFEERARALVQAVERLSRSRV